MYAPWGFAMSMNTNMTFFFRQKITREARPNTPPYGKFGTGPKYQEDKISDAKYQEQNIRNKISDTKYQEENIRRQISGTEYQTTNISEISLKYQELNFL